MCSDNLKEQRRVTGAKLKLADYGFLRCICRGSSFLVHAPPRYLQKKGLCPGALRCPICPDSRWPGLEFQRMNYLLCNPLRQYCVARGKETHLPANFNHAPFGVPSGRLECTKHYLDEWRPSSR
eukprot:110171-Amphidinium_carterae.1